jgi:hypothetical protein
MGKDGEGAVTVMVHIQEMPGRLLGESIPSPVGIHGGARDVANIIFVKADHSSRKGENGQPVDLLMGKKTPDRSETGN